MGSFKEKFLGFFRKIKCIYKKANKKMPYTEPIVVISTSLLIVLGLILTVRSVTQQQAITIAENAAEEYYYNNDFEGAINEFATLQETEEWPIYKVKTAEIYSIKGDFDKSNQLLAEAVSDRDKIIKANGRDKYIQQDVEFMNYVIFTYFMNNENEQALTLGEDYLKEFDTSKSVMRTMMTIYMVNGKSDKAIELVNKYPVNNTSSYDIALYAKMNMLLGNWDKGFEELKKSWDLNKDEIKIFDIITQFASNDSKFIEDKLIKMSNENPDEVCYKVWLAKVYSMSTETSEKANEIIEEVKNKDVGKLNFEILKSQVYEDLGRKEESEEIIKKVIANEENRFFGYHIAAWQEFKNKQYNKALEYCKLSILENKDYADNYVFLISDILIAKGEVTEADSYLRTGLRLEPFNYNIIFKTGDYYANTANYKKAQSYYEIGLKIKNDDAKLHYNLAHYYRSDNNLENAIKELNKCVELDKNNISYLRTLGAMNLEAGNEEKGIEYTRAAYALDNNDPLTLNNAAVYYMSIEGDVERGMVNMESAYKNLDSVTDLEAQDFIITNYKEAKDLYEKYKSGSGETLTVPEFTLFY